MQYSDGTTLQGIVQRALFLAFGDSQDHTNDYTLAAITASANQWMRTIAGWILDSDGVWEYDDSNQSTLPWATTNLVSNQRDYTMPTNIMKIMGVSIMDNSGNWNTLSQINRLQVTTEQNTDLEEQYSTPSQPEYYDVVGNSIMLYPAADNGISVTLNGGMRVFLSRSIVPFSVPTLFTTNDTTIPGFSENYHEMLCLGVAYDYLFSNGQTSKADSYWQKIQTMKTDLQSFYGLRNQGNPPAFSRMPESFN